DPNFLLDTIDHLLHVAGQRTLLDEDHRHAATDVITRRPVHHFAAMTIEANVHLWTAILVVTGLGIGHLITGDDQGALQLYRRTALCAELKGFSRRTGSIRFRSQAEFKIRRLAEDAFGLSGILHARQFHDDAIGALTL